MLTTHHHQKVVKYINPLNVFNYTIIIIIPLLPSKSKPYKIIIIQQSIPKIKNKTLPKYLLIQMLQFTQNV